VWCRKYRCRILGGGVATWLVERWELIVVENAWQLVAREVMADHAHRLVVVCPTDVPVDVVSRFKGRAARVLGQVFPWLAKMRVL
jgi:putative transposase